MISFSPSITASISGISCEQDALFNLLDRYLLGIFYSISKPLGIFFQLFVVVCLSAATLYAFPALTVIIVLSKDSLIASNVLRGKMVVKRFNN